MGLVTCPDCGRQVSDAATACVGCGRPIYSMVAEPPELPLGDEGDPAARPAGPAPQETMGFGDAISSVFQKYAVFSGRSRRSEYWWFSLLNFVLGMALLALHPMLQSIYSLVTLVPGLAVSVRRLHDINRSAWWLFAPLLASPILGILIAIALFAAQGTGRNRGSEATFAILLLVSGILLLGYVILMLVWMCTDGTRGPNRFGPDPKLRR
jgi:uncharacterized membrane protein YhaH (DUF805 family)